MQLPDPVKDFPKEYPRDTTFANGDGIVDAADIYIMVDHWGEDYPLCDIGPMP
jgi:hypothetical protein